MDFSNRVRTIDDSRLGDILFSLKDILSVFNAPNEVIKFIVDLVTSKDESAHVFYETVDRIIQNSVNDSKKDHVFIWVSWPKDVYLPIDTMLSIIRVIKKDGNTAFKPDFTNADALCQWLEQQAKEYYETAEE